ncbi:hypothetical protein SAMN06264364_110127 [Quadrisphaera granulorum]|uniref:Uncharacterized protein n=1 Tax=Quadrisphaera granulorum TaxID=317664 RepID=A0A316AAJ8_9ACTN|nr:hypothetical protein BXY45_110127 [Quadrisphaera granulorum]SZE96641.1 hypothetical protein SAMN06264364_110127 [Quadrisphaera granulorum]
MAKRIEVTRAQKAAAQIKMNRSEKTGRYVSPATKAIANARPLSKSGTESSAGVRS